MPRCALHPNCHLLHDGLDSDDVGFPPIRVRESTPVSRRAPPSPPNYNSSRRQSSSQSHTSPSPSPQLSRSRRGLGNKNVLNTVRITVHQAKDVPNSAGKRSAESLDTADHRPLKRPCLFTEDDADWLKREIKDIKQGMTEIADHMRAESAKVDLKLEEILHEVRLWGQI